MDTQIRTRGAAWGQIIKEAKDRGYAWEHQHDLHERALAQHCFPPEPPPLPPLPIEYRAARLPIISPQGFAVFPDELTPPCK